MSWWPPAERRNFQEEKLEIAKIDGIEVPNSKKIVRKELNLMESRAEPSKASTFSIEHPESGSNGKK